MPSLPWIFICPSSRGIGHALTRRLLQTTRLPVLATTRQADPSRTRAALLDGLRGDGGALSRRLSLVRCDVADEASVRDAARRAAELFPRATHHLHLACAVPGVLRPERAPAQVDAAAGLAAFQVNALGPLLLAKHFCDFLPRRATAMPGAGPGADPEAGAGGLLLLPRHATWLLMAARVGSTADDRAGGWFTYRASKAAVISLARSLDLFLQARAGDRALAVAYHPGTVRTDLSREFWAGVPAGRLFSPEYAAARMVDVICGLGVEQRGRCWDWKGDEVPP